MMQAFAERFNFARQRKGLSLQDIADQMGNISKQALHKYEQGKARPDGEGLLQLCTVLEVDPDYFLRPVTVSLQQIDFRKRVKLTKTNEGMIVAEATDYFERFVEIEKLTGERNRFKSPIGIIEVSTRTEVEEAAKKFRHALKLGMDPIPNVIGLLDDMGIKCFQLVASAEFDGLTAVIDNDSTEGKHIGIVVNQFFDVVRQRFTASHELAHQILKFPPTMSSNDVETLCHYFAGALLLPGERMIQILSPRRKQLSIYELIDIKIRFGVSMQAILRRAKDLDIISNSTYTGLSIFFTKKGWRKDEPGKYTGEERAVRFQRLLHKGVTESLITLDKAVTLSGMSFSEFRESFV